MSAAVAATEPLVSVALIGATGLTGSHLLTQLLSNPSVARVYSLARRAPPTAVPDPQNKLTWHIEPDTSLWPNTLTTLLTTPPPPSTSTTSLPPPPVSSLLSALGTTRAAAGSVEAQRAIDYDLNLALARAARSIRTITTYVLISSRGASATSHLAYVKMKGELERDVIALGFPQTAILRPGLIIGGRDHLRLGELAAQYIEGGLRTVFGGGATEGWAQQAGWIARAAGRTAIERGLWEGEAGGKKSEERGITVGEEGKKVWFVGQGEIVRLAKEAGEKH